VYLKNFTQKNTELAMEGVAESNARVSDYMRNIDESKWLSDPKLDLIQTKEVDRHRIADFTLRGKQRTVHATNMGDIGSEGS
jgi:type IV pilus assembly protein PilN